MDGIEPRLTPKTRIDAGRRLFGLLERKSLHVPRRTGPGARYEAVGNGCDEPARSIFKIPLVGEGQGRGKGLVRRARGGFRVFALRVRGIGGTQSDHERE